MWSGANERSSEGGLPLWPSDVSTMRFLGKAETRAEADMSQAVEPAPTLFNATWDVRVFFRGLEGGLITRLGVAWGTGEW